MPKRKNAMGTIFPKRIQSTINGETTRIQSGYTPKSVTRKEGDRWTDDNGKEWEMKRGIVRSIPKFQDIRVPLFCPKCNNVMGKRSKDVEVYYKFGFCLECLIKRDSKMIEDGTFEEYEKNYIKSKQVGFYTDAKLEIEEYLKTLEKGYIEYVDQDGNIEKWEGDDLKKMKDFWENELKFINEKLEELN